MYKSIEIADVIGLILSNNNTETKFSFERIDNVLMKVRERKPFISIETRIESIRNIEDLIDIDITNIIFEDEIILPQIETIQTRFERQYYKLDVETRKLLSEIIKEIS